MRSSLMVSTLERGRRRKEVLVEEVGAKIRREPMFSPVRWMSGQMRRAGRSTLGDSRRLASAMSLKR